MSEKSIEITVTMTRKVPLSELREYDWFKFLKDEEILDIELEFADEYVHEWMDNDDVTFKTEGKIVEGEDE